MSCLRVANWFARLRAERLGHFPKRIYSLWIQGEAAAPGLVRLNWDRWARLNPDYDLVILDEATALRRIGDFPIDPRGLTPQAFSDVLRAKLLADSGGVWADASVFPVIPLSDWIDRCLADSSFFTYEAPGRDRLVVSWLLTARANSVIMKGWWDALVRYWCKPRHLALDENGQARIPDDPPRAVAPDGGARDDSYYYFWFHYLFAHLCETNPAFQRSWARCTRKSAGPPHRLQALLSDHPDADAETIAGEARRAEVQKLNWRVAYPLELLARL